ncbi:P-loop containing nucleoside triphosphate hydrolase protein [Aspergillus pseudoustus]|uniref:ATP-dependent RNA helicase n=1 Tax=Aspergillus pseudoustus TaxID=1810923 RepID=A0ABR4J1R4_9EURO
MLGAFRRSAVSHALRCSARTVLARSTPQRFQFLSSSIPIPSYAPRSLFHSSSLLCNSQADIVVQNEAVEDELSSAFFSELSEKKIVHDSIIKTITGKLGIESMTDVQRQTIPLTVRGGDVLAQAKTGTGKTIAFLIPVLQKLVTDREFQTLRVQHKATVRTGRRTPRTGNTDIRAIIISPTRELAEQIAVEASRLAHGSGLVVQTAVGGTQKRSKLQQIQREGCHILVATPGRLRDILSDPNSGITAPKLSTLVLDEADRLLDDGFGPEIMEIQHLLPDPAEVPRQTLMFSATMAREVMGMVRQTMKGDFSVVKTVRDDETPTHLSVPQKIVLVQGFENTLPAILDMAKRAHADRETSERPFKAIVYMNSTTEVDLAFEAFDRLRNDPQNPRSGHPLGHMFVGGISSRLSQAARTRVANTFRKCKTGILFSSDVTARGMDFPEVTHVIQIGLPRDRETYIHRLGRTARANKTGEGWVFLHTLERGTLKRKLHGIPVELDTSSIPIAHLDLSMDLESIRDSRPGDYEVIQQLKAAMKSIPPLDRVDACRKQLYHIAQAADNKRLVTPAIDRLAVLGYNLQSGPELNPELANRIGLNRRDGFRVKSNDGFHNKDGGFGRRRDGGFGDRRGGGFGSRRGGGFGGHSNGGFNDGRRDGRDRRGGSWEERRTNEWI